MVDLIRGQKWLALALFLLGLLLFQMGTRGLNEPDEGRYANMAEENLEADHPWWEPQLSDVGHYDKPPLIYWVTAVGFNFLGTSEWTARLPSFLGALLTLTGVGWAAGRLYGQRTAWLTVLVAGTTLHIWALARVLSPDMLLTGWCTLAVAAWVETRHRGGSWAWWSLQVLFWTMAGWTKATPMLIPMLGLAVYVFATKDLAARAALKLTLLLPLVLLLSLPWYVWVLYQHPDLKTFFFDREMLSRITGHIGGRHGPIYYYALISLVAWLPWWPLALFAFLRQKKNLQLRARKWRELISPELCILAIGFAVFSLVGSKLPTYTLPLAPWAALVMSRLIAREATLCRPPVLATVAGLTALIYATLLALAPAHQSAWGRNSSLKLVADFLHRQDAAVIHVDHFSPSLEFYWGEDVRYTGVSAPTEIADKVDEPGEHFEAAAAPTIRKGDWFIHYQKQVTSPFAKWLSDPRIPKTYIGDFVMGPLR